MHKMHVLYDTCYTHVRSRSAHMLQIDTYSSIQYMHQISCSYHHVFQVIIFKQSIQLSTQTGTNSITHTYTYTTTSTHTYLHPHPPTHASAYVTRHHKVSQICLHIQGIFDCNRGGGSPMYISSDEIFFSHFVSERRDGLSDDSPQTYAHTYLLLCQRACL